MNTKTIAVIAALGLLPIAGFAQTPPAPPSPPSAPGQPNPPIPPIPPNPPRDRDRDKLPKVPVTYLGVETSEVPRVLSEQMNLPKGFGLVVDYVSPDGPAAAAGVQQSDIIKMLNDQILMEPDQLAKLVRSYAEGTNVTLTILRKGAETKVTVKLGKREVPGHRSYFGPGNGPHPGQDQNFGMTQGEMGDMKFEFGDMNRSIRETVRNARREALRASRDARRAARAFSVVSTDKGAMRSTTIDLGKAQIVYKDMQGELKIETVDGKKVLTAKDPAGRLLFSGPVDTKEELDKVPADVRQRYDKLEQKDLPGVAPTVTMDNDNGADDDDGAADDNGDENDNDNDNDRGENNDNEPANVSLQQVSLQAFPRSLWTLTGITL
jgi:membrane-associated protease RseP (regulator of RpoE activity)